MEEITNSYLSFVVGAQIFAIHVSKVNEIREYEEPRNVPETISFMKGVVDFRDEVIPVIETAVKFGMKSSDYTAQTCIVVIDIVKKDEDKVFRLGIIADAVSDVFEAEEENFKVIENDYSPNYIEANYKTEDKHYLILNADEVFSTKDIIDIQQVIKQ